jgi:hypothetical protein
MAEIDIPAGAQPKDLWREAIQFHEAKGVPHDDALRLVICEWLTKGDATPLIMAGDSSDPVLRLIIRMLMRDPDLGFHLELVRPPNRRMGAKPKAGLAWRDTFMSMAYEQLRHEGLSSEDAYLAVAKAFGSIDHETVRSAVKSATRLAKAAAEDRLRDEQARRERVRDFLKKKIGPKPT